MSGQFDCKWVANVCVITRTAAQPQLNSTLGSLKPAVTD